MMFYSDLLLFMKTLSLSFCFTLRCVHCYVASLRSVATKDRYRKYTFPTCCCLFTCPVIFKRSRQLPCHIFLGRICGHCGRYCCCFGLLTCLKRGTAGVAGEGVPHWQGRCPVLWYMRYLPLARDLLASRSIGSLLLVIAMLDPPWTYSWYIHLLIYLLILSRIPMFGSTSDVSLRNMTCHPITWVNMTY